MFTCWVDLAQLILPGSDLELGEGTHSFTWSARNIDFMSTVCRIESSWCTWVSSAGVCFHQEAYSATHVTGAIPLSHLFLLGGKRVVSLSMNEETETHMSRPLPKIAQLVSG